MNPAADSRGELTLRQRLFALGQLMRVANVFTAVADVWMGLVLTTGSLPWPAAAGITAASALLYLAGMVLNDVHDHAIDAEERPGRPIPSGRISLSSAKLLGWLLLVAGIAAGWWTSSHVGSLLPGGMASLLALLVLAYDGGLKQTVAGPAVMALCRVANVMLGMSLAAEWGVEGFVLNAPFVPPAAIGLYIFTVTWIARFEAAESPRWLLVTGTLGVLLALGLVAAMPWLETTGREGLVLELQGWLLLWGVTAALVVRRLMVAVLQPRPEFVQRAVGHAILSLIMIDAGIVLGYVGPYWALAILCLLVPSSLLAQWFKVS